jgi:hypothetical protein
MRHGDRGHREGAGVHEERDPDVEDGDQQAPERRSREAQADRLHQLPQGVGLKELIAWHHVRHDRREGRLKERLAEAVKDHEHDQVPELGLLRNGERRDHGDGREAHEVRDHQQAAALEAVAQHAGEQEARHLGERPRESDDRERAGLVRDVVDEPGDRDQVDAVADERHGLTGPQQPEVAVARARSTAPGYGPAARAKGSRRSSSAWPTCRSRP